jgi:D-glycero-D-manno-heptose 1,7-bisphosphate phosphatase
MVARPAGGVIIPAVKKPAIFFDRDNTLIASDGYLGDPAGVRLIPGAADAVARARDMGFAVVTFSNQSGVARGMFSEDAVVAVNEKMAQLLGQENPQAKIDRHEFCPFHPEATVEKYRMDSDRRKPKPGMILGAAKALDLDLSASWVLGDAPRDIEAGHAAGCRTILVSDPSVSPSPATVLPSSVDPDESVAGLAEAMDIIEACGVDEPAPIPGRVEDLGRIEHLLQQILDHIRRQNEHPADFSLGKMLAGVTQILAIALAVGSYFYKPIGDPMMPMLAAIFLQALTVSLLLMGREN